MIVRPWVKGDYERLDLQAAQQYIGELAENVDLTELSEAGLAKTIEVDNRVIFVGGLMPQWHNRAIAFALVAQDAGGHFVTVHRAVQDFFFNAPYRRIEAHVDVGFEQGVRWMRMLGFELEAYKKAFRPDGADMLEFVRIR
jgi:hypothetical protein